MNHPHHHHPHHPHHHHHPHPHGVAIGPLPNQCIGMVAAPTAAGPMLAGIGVPIMTAAAPTLVPPPPLPTVPHNHQQSSQQHKKLVMTPDSSEDKDKCPHPFIQARTSPPGTVQCSVSVTGAGSQLTWTQAPQAPPGGPLLPGIAYPVMGLPQLNGEPNAPGMIYGVSLADHQVSPSVNNAISIPSNNGLPQQPQAISISTVIPNQTSQPAISPQPPSLQNQSQQQQPPKEIIHCKSCTLFPPNPNAPPPTTRDKPPGCRTAFVGGLPENIREDLVREIFEKCGEITTIRMSKKNFCHIRFELEDFVENALYLSGYRIRIGSNSDSANIGRLHVDYAQARDDLYEWECRQRQLQREQRHRERLEQERLHPPSPPPTLQYSDHEAANLAERIKGDDTFMKAIQILFNWLEKGECLKKNSNTFYSMIQSTNSQIRRLLNEKSQYEDEFQKAKDLMRQRMTGLLMQFTQIEKVFSAACQRKVWDHFSKAQRKNIEVWKTQAVEIKNVLLEDALHERADEEMELSDLESDSSAHSNKENGEPPRPKKMRLSEETKTVHQLKEENDALRCQLEASKNEVDLIKADLRSELEMKDQQLRTLQQQIMEIQGSPLTGCNLPSGNYGTGSSSITGAAFAKQMLPSPPVSVSSSSSPGSGMSPTHTAPGSAPTGESGAAKSTETSTGATPNKNNTSDSGVTVITVISNKDMQGFCDSSSSIGPNSQQSAQSNHNQNGTQAENNGSNGSGTNDNHQGSHLGLSCARPDQVIGINEKEAKLLGIISTFLVVHPFGASLDYVWSYAQKLVPLVRPNQIEVLMHKFPTLFKQEVSGVGATFERKWVFVGFT